MKRRTYRDLRADSRPTKETRGRARREAGDDAGHHHHVYVVLLDPAARSLPSVRAANRGRDPEKPCVYVGMTGLTPEERFANHRAGIKSAYVVRRFGVRLMPELFEHLNPMPFEAAAEMEVDLAEDLRRAGYTVTGGH